MRILDMKPLLDHLADRASAFGADAAPVTLIERPDALVIRSGGVVIKAHRSADEKLLGNRLDLVSNELAGIYAAPLGISPWYSRWQDWLVTAWPAGEPVDPEMPWAAPWAEAGRLLAQLHSRQITRPVPSATTAPRVATAISELRGSAAAETSEGRAVLTAAGTLHAISSAPPDRTLIHGDFHLGQLARFPELGWLLLDPDDLGLGDPRWDFARPASWFAIGLIGTDEWRGFVESYRDAGGNAIREWADIDQFAQAFTVHAAARAVVKALAEQRISTEVEREFISACARIADR